MLTFKKGGIHPPQNKFTESRPIEALEAPGSVTLLLGQHIGAPSVPVVKAGEAVSRGQMVAKAGGFVSVALHSPVSGVVNGVRQVRTADGMMADAIIIERTSDDDVTYTELLRDDEQVEAMTAEEIRGMARDAGLVGLGGACFPTHVKLTPPEGAAFDTLVVNGAECEPYLTCDDALMRSCAAGVIDGVRLAMKGCGARRAVIGVEDNKPEAIAQLDRECATMTDVVVERLITKYPQGGEKQLIEALTGRCVPSGQLPASVGVAVVNVATAFSLHEAVRFGKPLIERVVTVSGLDVQGGNYRVPIGVALDYLIEAAGGVPASTEKIILGGPMMGRAAENIDAPLTKGMSGVVFMDRGHRPQVTPCVRCARCVDACPMGLEPYLISTLARVGDLDLAAERGISDCIECGSCAYVCPSARPLTDYIRYGKVIIRRNKKK